MRGRVSAGMMPADLPGGRIDYTLYRPPGYDDGAARAHRYPTAYLLHGRGDTQDAWANALPDIDDLIVRGVIPPLLCIMPDAPWSGRAGYYVDSLHSDGAAIETAYTAELVPFIDAQYRTLADSGRRMIAGYSMGGAGAVRLALVHPGLFGAAIALSPAVYVPEPPSGSSARLSGAFGVGDVPFTAARYAALGYPAALAAFDPTSTLQLFIAVGDSEYVNAPPDDAHDLDLEAATLYNRAKRVPGVRAAFRVYGGGHDWSVWNRGLREGLTAVTRQWGDLPPHAVP